MLPLVAVAVVMVVLITIGVVHLARHHVYLLVKLRRWPDENDLAMRRRVVAARRRPTVTATAPRAVPSPPPRSTARRADALVPELVARHPPTTALVPVHSATTVQVRRSPLVVALGLLGLVAVVRYVAKTR